MPGKRAILGVRLGYYEEKSSQHVHAYAGATWILGVEVTPEMRRSAGLTQAKLEAAEEPRKDCFVGSGPWRISRKRVCCEFITST